MLAADSKTQHRANILGLRIWLPTLVIIINVMLDLPVGWRGDHKMHRPVSEEVHLSAVAVDYSVVAMTLLKLKQLQPVN